MDTEERKESKRGKRDCLCLAIEDRKNRNENMMYNFTTRKKAVPSFTQWPPLDYQSSVTF